MPGRGWRSLQATTLVGAVLRALRTGRVEPTEQPGRTPEVPATSRQGAVVGGRRTPPGPAAMRDRALAAGLPGGAAEALEERWPTLRAGTRAQVASPLVPAPGSAHVRWGAALAAQTDATTCGSAVLAMLAAAGDPGLALWLATGEELPGYVPPEVVVLRRVLPGAIPTSPERRFAAAQLAVKHVTNRLDPIGWPGALGTPPWGAVRAARHGGVRFRGELVDDADARRTAGQLDRVVAALEAGVPVPLYVQGDLGGGLAHAVPRHVVLLTGLADDGGLLVYEPGRGRVAPVPRAALLAPEGPRPELGGWTHAAWILLPRP